MEQAPQLTSCYLCKKDKPIEEFQVVKNVMTRICLAYNRQKALKNYYDNREKRMEYSKNMREWDVRELDVKLVIRRLTRETSLLTIDPRSTRIVKRRLFSIRESKLYICGLIFIHPSVEFLWPPFPFHEYSVVFLVFFQYLLDAECRIQITQFCFHKLKVLQRDHHCNPLIDRL